ncbi:MAG: hypothetical protein WDM79_13550 [Terricaulis sp.]
MILREGWTQADAEAVIARGDPEELLHIPLYVSLNPPDCAWSQDICIALTAHEHEDVRGNAVLGFGHLARLCGALDEARVRPILEAALVDPIPGRARPGRRRRRRYRHVSGLEDPQAES